MITSSSVVGENEEVDEKSPNNAVIALKLVNPSAMQRTWKYLPDHNLRSTP